jgi:hypothetical protein
MMLAEIVRSLSMRMHIRTHGCELTAKDDACLQLQVARLEKKLLRFQPDLVDLEVVIDKQARRREFVSHVRVVIMEQPLVARRNRAASVCTLLRRAFDDLDGQLGQLNSGLRGEEAWQRNRGARSAKGTRDSQRELAMLRAELDALLAGKQSDFGKFAESRLKGVRTTIFEVMTRGQEPPTDEQLDRALVRTMDVAERDILAKPDGWSLEGWLAWVATRELGREIHTAEA